jgi:hypothetical protein
MTPNTSRSSDIRDSIKSRSATAAADTAPQPSTNDTLRTQYRAELQKVRAQLSSALPPLQAAWGDWLASFGWKWYFTGTFAVDVHPEQARKRWLRWIDALEHHPDHSPRFPLIWARADEQQRRQVIHCHALVASVDRVSIFAAAKLWQRNGGGWAHIRPYNSGRGAAHYIAKGGDIELGPHWFKS